MVHSPGDPPGVRRLPPPRKAPDDRMAELVFFSGTMDCGKSTLALQMDHNHRQRGRQGCIFTAHDRAGESTLSSRLGLKVPAREVSPELDFWAVVVEELTGGARVD